MKNISEIEDLLEPFTFFSFIEEEKNKIRTRGRGKEKGAGNEKGKHRRCVC